MNIDPAARARSVRQAGFTLVELMISLALGLLITAAVGAIFVSSKQSFRTGEGVSQVQESGRFASLLMTPVVRQAGYLPDPVIAQTSPLDVFKSSLNKRAVFGTNDSAPTFLSFTGSGFTAANVKASTDVLVIAFVGKNSSNPPDNSLRTCLGDAVDASSMALNVFYIRSDSDTGYSSLNCYSHISAIAAAVDATGTTRNEPIVAGITDMQILYGVDTDADGAANRYLAADSASLDWTRVCSVQITYTVDSTDAVEKSTANTASTTTGIVDGRIRRTFSTTLQIRNPLR